MIQKRKGPRVAKTSNKNKAGRLTLPCIKMYYKATEILYWDKKKRLQYIITRTKMNSRKTIHPNVKGRLEYDTEHLHNWVRETFIK